MDEKIKGFYERGRTFFFLHNNMEEHSEEILAAVKNCFVDVKTAFGFEDEELSDFTRVTRNPFCKSASTFNKAMDDLDGDAREEIIRLCRLDTPEIKNDYIEVLRCFYAKRPEQWGPGKRKLNIRIDCDACKSSHVVPQGIVDLYDVLWADIINDSKIKEDISADTMNSFFALYQGITGAPMWGRNGISKKDLEDAGSVELAKRFELYAYLTHTAGNFILCYGSFNRDRRNQTKDFWDLTLECIREWYLSSEPVSDNPLNRGMLDRCAPWLNFFGKDLERGSKHGLKKWKDFVERNLLEPYIDHSSKDMRVYPFFPTHTFENIDPDSANKNLLPEDKQQRMKCLDAINACIIVRGNMIRDKLAEKGASPDSEDQKKKIERARKLLFGE